MIKKKLVFEEKLGDTVLCDICNRDLTNSEESGGFIFGSYAYCPDCEEEGLERIRKNKEEVHIKAFCPEDKSFADFCREYRGKNASIKMYEL